MLKNNNMNDVYISIRARLMTAVSRIVPLKDVEDIVQETYVRVCQVENNKPIDYPKSFLFKTARNLALDHIKRSESRLTSGVEDDDELDAMLGGDWAGDPYEKACLNSEFSQFCEAVRHLPVQCRKVFVLKKVYGYSQKEIAKCLGIAESTVEKHISVGIKSCTRFMASIDEENNLNSKVGSENVVHMRTTRRRGL